MASDDGEAAAARLIQNEAGYFMSATSCFEVCESLPHWNAAEYRRLYPNTLDARCFGALFSDGGDSPKFNRLGVRGDADVGTCNWRWESTGQWCVGITDLNGCFDKPFARRTDKVTYVHILRCVMCGTRSDWDMVERFELDCRAKPFNKFYLVRDVVN